MRDAGELRYLDGGGVGCMNEDERPTAGAACSTISPSTASCSASPRPAWRRSTIMLSAGRRPIAAYNLPVLLGTLGGIGLVVGPAGLLGWRAGATPR